MRVFTTVGVSLFLLFAVSVNSAESRQSLSEQFSDDVIRQEEEAFFRRQAEKEAEEARKKTEKRKAVVPAKKTVNDAKKTQDNKVSKTPVVEKKELENKTVQPKKAEPVKQVKTIKKSEPKAEKPLAEEAKSPDTVIQKEEIKNTIEDDKAALTKAAELEAEKLRAEEKKTDVEVKKDDNKNSSSAGLPSDSVSKKVKKDIKGLVYSAVAVVLVLIAGFLWFRNKKSNEEMMNVRNYHRNRNRGRYQR